MEPEVSSKDTTAEDKSPSPKERITRRRFLMNAGYAIGGALIGGVIGNLLPGMERQTAVSPALGQASTGSFNQALMHFTREQFQMVEAMAERIFPQDENGPGAKDLGVAYFIDHQLAGEWGVGGREYRQGPYLPGEKTQGYQGRLNRREIFQVGIEGVKNESLSKYGKRFIELKEEVQDQILTALQEDQLPLPGVSSAYFFSLLRSMTLEGVYSDPLYGGNRNMEGWRMKKFPGDQMAYIKVIESDSFVDMSPRSLRDHQ